MQTVNVLGKSYAPLCFIKNELLLYHMKSFYLMNTNNYEAYKICDIQFDDPRKWACFSPFGERASHISVYCGIEVEGGAVVAYNRGIYYLDIVGGKSVREKNFDLPDMRRPLNFFRIKDVDGFDDTVVYADYSYNQNRRQMSIYKRLKPGQWEKMYTFPSNTVRHIHSVIADPYRDRVIVLTGDFGDECGIWECKNNFSSIKLIMGGDQKYRACCARAYEEGIVIVTDSPFDQNYVYLIKAKDGSAGVEKIDCVMGPVVFYTYYGEDIVFSTDVEYDERHRDGLIKYISYKKAPGCKDWYSHLYRGNPYSGFKELKKFQKDIFPMTAFGFGNVTFPNGESKGKLFYYPMSVKKYGAKLCVLTD